MKKLLCLCAVLFLAVSTATAFAADVSGSWTTDFTGPEGNSFKLTFTFKQDGTRLTGTVQGAGGEPMALSDGKIDGDKISFNVSFNGLTIVHQGTFIPAPEGKAEDDQIKLTSKSDQGNFPTHDMTLKRAKSTP